MSNDAKWRSELTDAPQDAVAELGAVVLGALGVAPLAAAPLVWSSQEDGLTRWHVLALTDRTVMSAQLSMKAVEVSEITVTVMPIARVKQILWSVEKQRGWTDDSKTSVTFALGDATVTLPSPYKTGLSNGELAWIHALTERI